MNYEPHQQRVMDEANELIDRIEKLEAFFTTPTYKGLPEAERLRLTAQGNAMWQYHDILKERIAAFSEAAP